MTKATDAPTILRSPADEFLRLALEACVLVSPDEHTRRAYFADAKKWAAFCKRREIDPLRAEPIAVAAWVEEIRKSGEAPKTRVRRLSALSSVYDHLRRRWKVAQNPFSPKEGPKREGAPAIAPTPPAEAEVLLEAVRTCERDAGWRGGPVRFKGLRDAAILRVLWKTGVRRSSLVEVTHERLQRREEGGDLVFEATLPAKGRGGKSKVARVVVTGRAALALDAWIAELDRLGYRAGPIFRQVSGAPMTEREIWRAVSRRGRVAGGKLSPHGFRVAFLETTPATLEEAQHAAGHTSSETTQIYRREWRGRRAFDLMPDVEDVVGAETKSLDRP